MPSPSYNTAGIVLGPHDNSSVIAQVAEALGSAGVEVILEAGSAGGGLAGQTAGSVEEFGRRADLICCIGGDGTMLSAIARHHRSAKPFTGINLGHIGFLIDLPPADISSSFVALLKGESFSESRMLLDVEIIRNGAPGASDVAANEVFFRHAEGISMIGLDVFIDGHAVHTESGDGLLVSTPTGSTAYNLSCGGPILQPGIDAMVLTPICPNYLNSRPVVIGSEAVVEVRVPQDQQHRILVGCDGQRELVLEAGDQARVRKHGHNWTLLHPRGYEYFSLLRSKLKWGLGPLGGDASEQSS